MKHGKKGILLLVALLFVLSVAGCYTVVAFPGASQAEAAYVDGEETWADDGDMETEETTYLYGDVWPGDVAFDPYWNSPYWYDYAGYDPWLFHAVPWVYGYPFYAYGYSSYWDYLDPYYAFYVGYYAPTTNDRRDFSRRQSLTGSGGWGPMVAGSSGSGSLSKRSDTVSGSTARRRHDASTGTQDASAAASGGVTARSRTSESSGTTSIGRSRAVTRRTDSTTPSATRSRAQVRPSTRTSPSSSSSGSSRGTVTPSSSGQSSSASSGSSGTSSSTGSRSSGSSSNSSSSSSRTRTRR